MFMVKLVNCISFEETTIFVFNACGLCNFSRLAYKIADDFDATPVVMDTYGRYMMVDELEPGTTYEFSVYTRKDDSQSEPITRVVTTGKIV